VQDSADFDLGVLADIDGAIDEESYVGPNDLRDIHLQGLAIGADSAAHAYCAGGLLLVGAVEIPKADGEGGGILRR
jgi:hypothetical protein